jgi:hypothetical protein
MFREGRAILYKPALRSDLSCACAPVTALIEPADCITKPNAERLEMVFRMSSDGIAEGSYV